MNTINRFVKRMLLMSSLLKRRYSILPSVFLNITLDRDHLFVSERAISEIGWWHGSGEFNKESYIASEE